MTKLQYGELVVIDGKTYRVEYRMAGVKAKTIPILREVDNEAAKVGRT